MYILPDHIVCAGLTAIKNGAEAREAARDEQRRGARGRHRRHGGVRHRRRGVRHLRRARGARTIGLHGLVSRVRQGRGRDALRDVLVELPSHGGILEGERTGDGPEQVRRLHRGGVQVAHGGGAEGGGIGVDDDRARGACRGDRGA